MTRKRFLTPLIIPSKISSFFCKGVVYYKQAVSNYHYGDVDKKADKPFILIKLNKNRRIGRSKRYENAIESFKENEHEKYWDISALFYRIGFCRLS